MLFNEWYPREYYLFLCVCFLILVTQTGCYLFTKFFDYTGGLSFVFRNFILQVCTKFYCVRVRMYYYISLPLSVCLSCHPVLPLGSVSVFGHTFYS